MAQVETVRESQSRFRVMDAIPDGVVLRAADGRLIDVNRGLCRMTGFTREELVGQPPPSPFWPDEDANAVGCATAAYLAGGAGDFGFTFKRKNGKTFPVILTEAPAPPEWGFDGSCIVTVREVIGEQTVLRSSLDAIVVMDDQGRIVEFSPAAERTFGLARADVIGKDLAATIIPPEFRGRYHQGLSKHLAGDGDGALLNRRTEIIALRSDGYEIPIELTVTRDDVQGRPVFTAFIRDLSEQHSHEESLKAHVARLAALTAQLKRKNEELDQFAYVTSHDLKAPLRGIANLSQWIEEDMGAAFTPEAREQMELLRGRVRRMEALIDGILQLSRVGRVRTNPEAVDVSALLREIVDLLHPSEGFSIEIAAGMPTVLAERLRLEQVFMNLICNALKHHGPPPGRIDVSVREVGPMYEFAVRDDGPGIAPEYHDKIFVVFQTLAPRDKVEGTGLGLSLVRKIVEEQGGNVWVESREGDGATFRFTWPKQPKGAA